MGGTSEKTLSYLPTTNHPLTITRNRKLQSRVSPYLTWEVNHSERMSAVSLVRSELERREGLTNFNGAQRSPRLGLCMYVCV